MKRLSRLLLGFSLLPIWGISCRESPTPEMVAQHVPPNWSYAGTTGPENWARLDSEYALCEQGTRQSPIDLQASAAQYGPDPELQLQPTRIHLTNTGTTVEIELSEEQRLRLEDRSYQLRQFHFHAPSEHRIEGRNYPLEIHFVFAAGEALSVLGVLIEAGDAHAEMERFWKDLPANPGEQGHLNILIDPAKFFPSQRDQFRYDGSLTTPPCTEGVRWLVFEDPLEMSAEQLRSITGILGRNQRPLQPLDGHEVLLDQADNP